MTRLYRPYIPLKVRIQVAERQLADAMERPVVWLVPFSDTEKLKLMLMVLFGCRIPQLDHDPPLGARMWRIAWKNGKQVTLYSPDANDPAHLVYREKHEHHIKTNVRGEHGQHPDRVLIKRERRRKRKNIRPKRKIPSRPFPKGRKIPIRRRP
jgi:hypothetical protein